MTKLMIAYHTIMIEMNIHLYSLTVWIINTKENEFICTALLIFAGYQAIDRFFTFFFAFQASTICPRLELEPQSIYPVIIAIFQGFTVEWKRKRANTHDCLLYFSVSFFFFFGRQGRSNTRYRHERLSAKLVLAARSTRSLRGSPSRGHV